MKQKALRDGKKARKATRRLPPRKGHVGSVRRVEGAKKEVRFVVKHEDGEYSVFDPEACLHVGKHDGKVGIVYRFKEHHNRFSGGSWTSKRGLVRWDGEGGWTGARKAAAARAVELCGGSGLPNQKWVLKRLEDADFWGRRSFWKELAEKHALAVRIQVVSDVMKT